MCVYVQVEVRAQLAGADSLFPLWVLRMKLGLPGLVTGAFACLAASLASQGNFAIAIPGDHKSHLVPMGAANVMFIRS